MTHKECDNHYGTMLLSLLLPECGELSGKIVGMILEITDNEIKELIDTPLFPGRCPAGRRRPVQVPVLELPLAHAVSKRTVQSPGRWRGERQLTF